MNSPGFHLHRLSRAQNHARWTSDTASYRKDRSPLSPKHSCRPAYGSYDINVGGHLVLSSSLPPRPPQTPSAITPPVEYNADFALTPETAVLVRAILTELSIPTLVAFPDWDATTNGSRKIRLCCEASGDSFRASLEQPQRLVGPPHHVITMSHHPRQRVALVHP